MVRSANISDQILQYGMGSLSNLEILAILQSIKPRLNGHIHNSKSLLKYFGSFNSVINAAREDPTAIPKDLNPNLFGLRLPSEVTSRYLKERVHSQTYLDNPEDVIEYLKHSMQGLLVEQFRVIYLNGRNQVLNEEYQTTGTVGHAAVYPREVVKTALRHNSSAMILAHNHPSGNLQPSKDDIKITDRIYSAANLFDITLHDHLIITAKGYFSFADKNMIPNFNIYQHLNSK